MSIYRDLVIPQTIEDIVKHKDQAYALLDDAFKLFGMAEEEANKIGRYTFPCIRFNGYNLKELKESINRNTWLTAFDKTGLLQIMDREAYQKFQSDLDNRAPEFTLDNIRETFLSLYQQKDELFIRGLINVFRGLCRAYKTNDEAFKVPEKIIVGWWASKDWVARLYVNHHRSTEINDMDRVFKTLAGEKHHQRSLETEINAKWSKGEIFEDDYYQIKGFKNGNAHVKFKRLDLLEKANELIHEYYHGNAVPDGRHAA